MLQRLLNQSCQVYRLSEDKTKSYVQSTETLVGEYPCRIVRQNTSYNQEAPNARSTVNMRAFLDIAADLIEGDRLLSDGKNYTVTLVYKPNNDHIEADLRLEVVP